MKYFLLFSFLLSSAAFANGTGAVNQSGWSCRNTDVEINCSGGSCEVTSGDGFTPMDLSLEPGYMRVCAYSGCWEGKPILLEDDKTLYAFSHDLKWIHDTGPAPTSFQIALNKETKIAVLNGGGFAHPMQCERWSCGKDCQSGR